MTDNTVRRGEEEPLLGQPGDQIQGKEQAIQFNLVTGTAALAQAGIWILTAIVWAAVFNSELMLFSAHPLVNTAGLLLITQGILVLQPTHTPEQKATGTTIHALFNGAGTLALVAGLIIIEYNKFDHGAPAHFDSIHGKLGLITYILFVVQALVGFTQYYTPSIYGGVDNAKAVWKYHRASGYITIPLSLAAVCAATQTDFNVNSLHIQLWAAIVTSVLLVAGLYARMKLQKLGLKN